MKPLSVDQHTLRNAVRQKRSKSTILPLLIFTLDLFVYATGTYSALTATDFRIACIWGAVAGVGIGMLFAIGHDACHGSLTPHRRLNGWIGRVAFLPSLTPFSAWNYAHNQIHHVYTNLKPLDYVWAPFSKQEYDGLPRSRQMLERLYRTAPGVGAYYALEIWWRRLILSGTRTKGSVLDLSLCCVYGLTLLSIGCKLGFPAIFAGIVLPFICWNLMMGCVIFEHHTHPEVAWFDNEETWRAASARLRSTVRVILPAALEAILHNIMQHSAHHLDVTIPLYRLHRAQTALESVNENGIVRYQWTPRTFLRHLRICKLYDFESCRWLDFAGKPTT